MKRAILLLSIFCFVLRLSAQETPKPFKFEFGGFVNYEIIYDTRQVATSRESEVLLYPLDSVLDSNGDDINAVGNLNFLILSSRLFSKISGPNVFGAKSMAYVEGDFLGTTNDKYNLFRLRHAYIKLNWEKSEILAGQTWHPMFVAACYPNVLGFGGALPYHVLSRAPMLKYTYKPGNTALSAYILTQNDFPATGPIGTSSTYLRNSGIPEMYGQVIYSKDAVMLGATGGYMVIKPSLTTAKGIKTDATIGGFTGNAFIKLSLPALIIRAQGIYSDNPNHLVMIGGYGETAVTDSISMTRGYSNVSAMAVWGEVETRGDKFRIGLFGGYSKNLGSKEDITGSKWIRGGDIASMYRIGPRILLLSGNAALGAEVFYDVVSYGTPDLKYHFDSTHDISNIRAMMSIRYYF